MVVMYCDASFNDKTLKCGCGILIKELIHGGVKETRIQVSDYANDNNEAELKSIYYGISHLQYPLQGKTLNIITDSVVAIECLKKCIYRGDYSVEHVSPKYREICRRILNALGGEKVRLYHCKGHNQKTNVYNKNQQICDKLAKSIRKELEK